MMTGISTFLKVTDSFDLRRYLAILFMAGGSIAFTLILVVLISGLWGYAAFLFWIAIGSMIIILVTQTGFIALIAKREVMIDKSGKVTVRDIVEGDKKTEETVEEGPSKEHRHNRRDNDSQQG